MIITICAYHFYFGIVTTILIIEILCYIAAPIYFAASPIVLMWNEAKLRPKIKIRPVDFDENSFNGMMHLEATDEGDLRLQKLEDTWNKKFSVRAEEKL